MHEKEHKSALEVVMTVLHAGGKFDKGSYKVSGGLHGVGVSCVNALSDMLHVEVRRNGKTYMQEYQKGKPMFTVKEIGTSEHTGTTVTFHPDETIFSEVVYHYDILASRMRELAYLNSGIKITLTDKRETKRRRIIQGRDFLLGERVGGFHSIFRLFKSKTNDDVIHLCTDKFGSPVEIAMTYNDSYNENIFSYVNNINTIEGGTHVAGFRRGLTRTLKKYAEEL